MQAMSIYQQIITLQSKFFELSLFHRLCINAYVELQQLIYQVHFSMKADQQYFLVQVYLGNCAHFCKNSQVSPDRSQSLLLLYLFLLMLDLVKIIRATPPKNVCLHFFSIFLVICLLACVQIAVAWRMLLLLIVTAISSGNPGLDHAVYKSAASLLNSMKTIILLCGLWYSCKISLLGALILMK